jgi:single-stranded-DNA-specific exonuclease
MANWIDPQPVAVSDAMRETVGGHPLVAEMLVRRGFTTPADARAFLDPNHYSPAPAGDLPDIDQAVDRIWRGLAAGERVAVFGDFDVDGLTATALLVEALHCFSSTIRTQGTARIHYRIPQRNQGHGIDLVALDELLDQGTSLLITCDTGVDAFAAIERAAARSCEVIVTDHHDLPDRLPIALAVVNPKRLNTGHPLRELPGVGVAYKVVEHLFQRSGLNTELKATLDLVALGIVADVATQVDDVRYLLQRGLQTLRATQRVGLRALLDQAELEPEGLTEGHIGYQIAPRLNALGRMGDSRQGVDLLLTQDLARARILAAEMDGLNYQRRLVTSQVTEAALTQIERDPSLLDFQALVVAGHNWHPGVLGLVAGRLAEQFKRPAVVLSVTPEGKARGSARSVPGCDIHLALIGAADWLIRFGGHPRAAGLTLDPSNLAAFRRALSRSVESVWDPAAASPGLQIDSYVTLDQLSPELVGELERLAPFGPGNPAVQLATYDLQIVEDALIGRSGEHRRVVVADQQGAQQTVLWWQGAGQALPEGRFDLAYALRARDYRGETQLQVEWIESRPRQSTTSISSGVVREVVDWRGEVDPLIALAGLPDAGSVIWAEGEDPSVTREIRGTDRLGLTPSPILVIWTAPPGPDELTWARQAVNPERVYLFAFEPTTARLRVFMERLAGMVKHDLRARGGQVDTRRLSASLGHREETVRAGLDWLVARGQLRIVEAGEGTLTLQAGGEPSSDSEKAQSHLRRLLEETAAYRRHFRTAPTETLGISASS